MTDHELDEILDDWQTPDVPSALRPRTLSRFVPKEKRRIAPVVRKILLGVAVAAMLLIAVQAIPQTFSPIPSPPYTVESEFFWYSPDGGRTLDRVTSSYADTQGREVVLSTSFPGHPFRTAMQQVLDFVHVYILRSPTTQSEQRDPAGCMEQGTPDETILGYSTLKVARSERDLKFALWRAPDLECFPMRLILERRGADGALHLTLERNAIKVSINPR